MWCGEREFPVPQHRVAAWQREDWVQAYLLLAGDAPVGYGELWLDAEDQEAELARIIIAPAARATGHGRTLVRGLLAQAVNAGYRAVFLRVHPDNAIALRCYLGAGFVAVDARLAEERNTGQPVSYEWLRSSPED
jgi:ribosomal protein S18 acetylase RimI-like enzyme